MEQVKVGKAILAGFIATLVMTVIMRIASMIGLPKMDVASMLGSMLTQTVPEPMSGPRFLGLVLHFLQGSVVFPLLFAYLFYKILPGPSWFKGIIWALILWFVLQVVIMPKMGAGFFSSHVPQTMMRLIGSLIVHVIYGIILGGIYGKQPLANNLTA